MQTVKTEMLLLNRLLHLRLKTKEGQEQLGQEPKLLLHTTEEENRCQEGRGLVNRIGSQKRITVGSENILRNYSKRTEKIFGEKEKRGLGRDVEGKP